MSAGPPPIPPPGLIFSVSCIFTTTFANLCWIFGTLDSLCTLPMSTADESIAQQQPGHTYQATVSNSDLDDEPLGQKVRGRGRGLVQQSTGRTAEAAKSDAESDAQPPGQQVGGSGRGQTN